MVAACYRYVVLGVLAAVLVVLVACAIEAFAPEDTPNVKWMQLLYIICIAGAAGALVSHIYDNDGKLKLPEVARDELKLAVFGDILIGLLAAFAAIYLLHATVKADLNLSPGIALLAGLTGTRLIPGFRDSIARQLKNLEEDVKKGEKKLTARDYHQWGDLKAAQKKYIEAIEFYEYALEADPKYTPVLSALADAYLHMAEEADTAEKKETYMKKALEYNELVEKDAGSDPEKLGGACLQRANILKAMGKVRESAASLKTGIEHFKAAKKEDDRIFAYVMANEHLAKAAKAGDAQIKAIISSLQAKAEAETESKT